MKDKVGKLIDTSLVKSPAKYILSTSEYLWVTLHEDNIVRIWNISDGRCLMVSPKELFLTKLRRIYAIPTYDGYLLCFGEDGDVYIINMFQMRLLKHSSIDIEGISKLSLIKIDQDDIKMLVTDAMGKITVWRIKTNKVGMNIQTVCSENDFEIDFELRKVLSLPDEYSRDYLLVYSEDDTRELLTVSPKEVILKQFEGNVENVIVADKFTEIGAIIFATTIQKNEGVYLMLISETYDIIIDRIDQLTEKSAPLIKINLVESSELNGKQVSAVRLEELLEGQFFKYDDNKKMLYVFLHSKKKMLAWFINDMLRNSRFYTYANNQDIFKPETIPMQ
jgi:WD40 repeat protein